MKQETGLAKSVSPNQPVRRRSIVTGNTTGWHCG